MIQNVNYKHDISLIINLHNEGELIVPTINSIIDSVFFTKNKIKVSIEAVFVFDNASIETIECFQKLETSDFDYVKELHVNNGSLGLSRNDGINSADGKYIITFDADDLVNECFILAMYEKAISSKKNSIIFPEYLLGFGDENFIVKYYPTPFVPPFAFFGYNPYISRFCMLRESALNSPFLATPSNMGLAYEDWCFNTTLISKDFIFHTAKDASIYYRQRKDSLLKSSQNGNFNIPFTDFFQFKNYVRICDEYIEKYGNYTHNRFDDLNIIHEFYSSTQAKNDLEKSSKHEPLLKQLSKPPQLLINNVQTENAQGLQYLRVCRELAFFQYDKIFIIDKVDNLASLVCMIGNNKFENGLVILLRNSKSINLSLLNSENRRIISLCSAYDYATNLGNEILLRILQNKKSSIIFTQNAIDEFSNKILQINCDYKIAVEFKKDGQFTEIINRIIKRIFPKLFLKNKINSSGLFDTKFYAETYKISEKDSLKHFLQIGLKSNNNPSKFFNSHFYLKNYKDVETSGTQPFLHYIQSGINEGRNTTFDDLTTDEISKYEIISRYGMFDNEFYRKEYLNNDYNISPISHFLKIGCKKWYRPCQEFDGYFYFNQYKDVNEIKDCDCSDALIHFILHGRINNRICKPQAGFENLQTAELIDKTNIFRNIKETIKSIKRKPNTILFTDDSSQKHNIDNGLIVSCTTKSLTIGDYITISSDSSDDMNHYMTLLIRALNPNEIAIDFKQTPDFFAKKIDTFNYIKTQEPIKKLDLQLPTEFEVSIIINAHKEGEILIETINSAIKAAETCLKNNVSYEIILILDNCDDKTLHVINKFKNRNFKIVEVNEKDLGLSRNHGIKHAKGKYIAFLDGDDLWCDDWLIKAYQAAQNDRRQIIWHPQTNIYFGTKNFIYNHIDMEEPAFDLYNLLERNLWTALSFGERGVFANFPFPKTNLEKGVGFEDWSLYQIMIENGVIHKVVPDTQHYIRTKEQSLLQQTKSNDAMPYSTNLFVSHLIG